MRARRCETCEWWEFIEGPTTEVCGIGGQAIHVPRPALGICHRLPPVLGGRDNDHQAEQPAVDATDYCGEWTAREEDPEHHVETPGCVTETAMTYHLLTCHNAACPGCASTGGPCDTVKVRKAEG